VGEVSSCMTLVRKRPVLLAVVVLLPLVAMDTRGAPAGRAAEECPGVVARSSFASARALRSGTKVMADLGPRPTASPAHERFIGWVERRLAAIDGLEVTALPDTIERQVETSDSLVVDGAPVPTAGPVPYALPAPAGVTAPMVYVEPGTAVADVEDRVKGKIVVRDAVPGTIPMALFNAVAYYVHDPGLSFDWTGSYERDWIGAAGRIADLEQAGEAGAAGLVFLHDLPRSQVAGQYAPYPGVQWKLPAVYLGVDEAAPLRSALVQADLPKPRRRRPMATLALAATEERAPTRTVIATLPGQSDERIVIQSYTDGMNAVWDNGPISILAMARWFAGLPIECRPRTLQFVFTTAHLHLSHAGADKYAEILDEEYPDGTVALVVALEHLGAEEFVAVPRAGGPRPGRRLSASGQSELFATFTIESPVLAASLIDQIVRHDLRRTFVLRGADAPAVAFPPHRSYGGEGGPYREHLVPTVAAITGPWTLFDPASAWIS
jgi:hypothetical protein